MLLGIMFLTVFDIVARSLFRMPILGSYEITQFLLAIFVLLGIGYTEQVDGHVKVTLFSERMPRRLRIGFDIFVSFLSSILFAVVVWKGWIHAVNAFHSGLSSDILRIPAYPFLFILPLGAGFLCLEIIIKLFTLIVDIKRR